MKKFLQLVNEQEQMEIEKDPNEIVEFKISSNLEKMLRPLMDEYKVAELYLKLKYGVIRKNLSKDPPDFLDVDNEGNLSYLKSRYFTENDPWSTTRRIKMKITKALRDFYNETYLNSIIKQTDIEAFVNRWNVMLKNRGTHVEEYRGDEVMRAFNYKKELSPNFSHSCANFHQSISSFGKYSEPKVSEFDIYTKNPEQIGVVVAWDNGVIMGRRTIQQGIQVCDSGSYKTGEHHTVYGNYYGVGGTGGKYDIMIKDYIKKKWTNATEKYNGDGGRSSICISLETRFTYYCPFDSMYVCYEHNLMTDNYQKLPYPQYNYSWTNTYHAICPKKYVKQRIEEENSKNPAIDIEVRPLSNRNTPQLPYKRILTEDEIESMCKYFPHYTWAKGIDANGKLIMSNRNTFPPSDERGNYYLTEKDVEILTGKIIQDEPPLIDPKSKYSQDNIMGMK